MWTDLSFFIDCPLEFLRPAVRDGFDSVFVLAVQHRALPSIWDDDDLNASRGDWHGVNSILKGRNRPDVWDDQADWIICKETWQSRSRDSVFRIGGSSPLAMKVQDENKPAAAERRAEHATQVEQIAEDTTGPVQRRLVACAMLRGGAERLLNPPSLQLGRADFSEASVAAENEDAHAVVDVELVILREMNCFFSR